MTTLLAFLFVLGVLIFVHELGHFLAARRIGVRVLTFSLGFGPKLIAVRRGDTEYCVSVIPLGGYVKMAGENPEDPRSGAPDEFLSKSKWQRFQVLIMGPVMNILLAFVLSAVVLAQGAQMAAYKDEPPVVASVMPGSPADKVGIKPGDRILTVAGRRVDTWDDLDVAIGIRRVDRDVTLTLLHEGMPRTVTLRPVAASRSADIGEIGVVPDQKPFVRSTIKGDPADRAGVKPGDAIVAINGERMFSRLQVSETISRNGGHEIDLTLRRADQQLHIAVTPELRDIPETHEKRAMIGVNLDEATKSFKPGPLEAVTMSVRRNIDNSGLIFRTLVGLFTGETSVRQLQGPVGIAQLSGESAQAGLLVLLNVMAMISLNLGILNLMPVPVLDGGHILIMALEGIARRDFSMQVKEKMLLAGFVVLMMLMVTVIYNDLTRISWIERLMPWRN